MLRDKEKLQCCIFHTLQDERFYKARKNIPKKTLKKNREDSFEVQLNKNSEGLVTVVVHAMKNV